MNALALMKETLSSLLKLCIAVVTTKSVVNFKMHPFMIKSHVTTTIH